MTTATVPARWWSPEGEVGVHQLLRPGADSEKDLGLALLALHKAGAEACDLVSKTAVADEVVLVNALAETRAAMAAPAVRTIAKSVGGPQYAGLLLADLLDDAEVAALALYRTCLAKSVAPPIAAERVGMVYGVPSRDLSKYSALATDPKANPRAVADLADRTLFDYVAKVVAEEYVPAKELVSKAPTRDWHGKDPGERDAEGQFTRVRAPGSRSETDLQALFDRAEAEVAAPQQVGTPATEGTPGPQQVGGRQLRTLRTLKQHKTLKTLKTAPAEIAPQQINVGLKTNMLNVSLSPEQIRLQELTVMDPSPMPLGGIERSVPRLDVADTAPGPNAPLERAVSFILPDSEFLAVSREAGVTATGRNVMRLGPLEEYAGQARLYDDGRGELHEHHTSGVEHVLDIMGEKTKGEAAPVVASVPGNLITNEAALTAAKQKFLEMQVEKGYRINVAQEISKVRHAPLKSDMGKMALVWRPPSQDSKGRTVQSPIPGVVELVVKKGSARGSAQGNGRVQLSGDSAVQMRGMFDRTAGPEDRLQVYDDKLGAFRTVVALQSASEEDIASARWKHSKAVTPDNPATRHFDGRDTATGQWASQLRSSELQSLFDAAAHREVKMAKPRQIKSVKTLRTVKVRPQSIAPQEIAPRQVDVSLAPATLKAHQLAVAAVRRPTKPAPGELYLDHDAHYAVLTPWTMNTALGLAGFTGYTQEGAVVPLDGNARRFLGEQDPVPGGDAVGDLTTGAVATWNRARRVSNAEDMLMPTAAKGERPVLTHTLTDRDEVPYLMRFVTDQMDQDVSLSVLNVRLSPTRDGRVKIVVTGNVEALAEQHIVDLEEVEDIDSATALVAEGVYRTQNAQSMTWLMDHFLDRLEETGHAFNDTIANPVVRRWRAEQQP